MTGQKPATSLRAQALTGPRRLAHDLTEAVRALVACADARPAEASPAAAPSAPSLAARRKAPTTLPIAVRPSSRPHTPRRNASPPSATAGAIHASHQAAPAPATETRCCHSPASVAFCWSLHCSISTHPLQRWHHRRMQPTLTLTPLTSGAGRKRIANTQNNTLRHLFRHRTAVLPCHNLGNQ